MTDDRATSADAGSGVVRGGANLRLLVELVPHRAPTGVRRFTAGEIAAGLRITRSAVDDIAAVIEAVLSGSSDVVPDELVAPLAMFFGVPATDLTDDPVVAETAILERLLVERGAGGVLFCRDHLSRAVANRLLRAVLEALRGGATRAGQGHPP